MGDCARDSRVRFYMDRGCPVGDERFEPFVCCASYANGFDALKKDIMVDNVVFIVDAEENITGDFCQCCFSRFPW